MKPRIIGLINAWYSEQWIAAAIEQALQYCDEVIVAVGSHSKSLASLKDKTYEIASRYKNQIILLNSSILQFHDRSKADTLNRMLAISKFRQKGNWIWILDVDEFYFDCTYQKIFQAISSNLYDHIRIEEKFFFINMTRYLLCSHGRLFRIGQSNNHFQPTQRWTGPLNKQYIIKRDAKEHGMFHYSLLTTIEYRRLMWETEHLYKQPHKLKWLLEIYAKYDLNNEETWISRNQQLFGYKSPFFAPPTEVEPDKNGKLFVYNGQHPPHIEAAGLTAINDFRKI